MGVLARVMNTLIPIGDSCASKFAPFAIISWIITSFGSYHSTITALWYARLSKSRALKPMFFYAFASTSIVIKNIPIVAFFARISNPIRTNSWRTRFNLQREFSKGERSIAIMKDFPSSIWVDPNKNSKLTPFRLETSWIARAVKFCCSCIFKKL